MTEGHGGGRLLSLVLMARQVLLSGVREIKHRILKALEIT